MKTEAGMTKDRGIWWWSVAVLLIVGLGFGFTPGVDAQTYVCGDDNGDGSIGVADVFYLVNMLFAAGPGPTNCPAPAGVEKTGQTTCWDAAGASIACAGTGQDGEKQKGVAWPNPRFTDNGNGTVRDNLTSLIWLKNANCFGTRAWATALTDANGLASGSCGLTDGSVVGDWRLPNSQELYSLIDLQFTGPAMSNAAGTAKWTEGDAFSGVQSFYYWSSSTLVGGSTSAWFVNLNNGLVGSSDKPSSDYVWPVRGGQ